MSTSSITIDQGSYIPFAADKSCPIVLNLNNYRHAQNRKVNDSARSGRLWDVCEQWELLPLPSIKAATPLFPVIRGVRPS
ncbi:hypothetical protein CDAR_479831 [Caerostris darwini]|uniref:Uncharacterized protein n=1 Tax=Caerostris darwini TaxID=1538125 RepID=A0AAV4SX20_9ARAC|nr:hypothetical protein CDAR_479831 [Caerostris darwini]